MVFGHVPFTTSPTCRKVNAPEQLSEAVPPADTNAARSAYGTGTLAPHCSAMVEGHTSEGDVVSRTVISCTTVARLLQASATV